MAGGQGAAGDDRGLRALTDLRPVADALGAGGVLVLSGAGISTEQCMDGSNLTPWPMTWTVSYVVSRTLTRYGAWNVELDRAGRVVGDREAVDPSVEGAAAGWRYAGHA